MSVAERLHLVRIVERRRGRAVGQAELSPENQVRAARLRFQLAEAAASCAAGVGDAEGVLLAGRADAVADDLLHRALDVQVEEPVPEARPPRLVRIGRRESAPGPDSSGRGSR